MGNSRPGRTRSVARSVAEFNRIGDETPILADLKPGGRFTAVDFSKAGGTAEFLRRLRATPRLVDTPTCTGQTLFEAIEASPRAPANAPPVFYDLASPYSARTGFAILFGDLSPEGCLRPKALCVRRQPAIMC